MSWIDDYKDGGPWDFTEQANKWGYLNNKRWSSQLTAVELCNDLGLVIDQDAQHAPCGHWHKINHAVTTTRTSYSGGRWVAALSQPDTPYVYLYDVSTKAVIKLETTASGIVYLRGVLLLDHLYQLDYDMGYGIPGAQRGGYCIDKDGTRLWYLFRELPDPPTVPSAVPLACQLIEVDISSSEMSIVKKTVLSSLCPANVIDEFEVINDGCSDNICTYWATSLVAGRIIRIYNADHTIVKDITFNFVGPVPDPDTHTGDKGISSIDADASRCSILFQFVRDAFRATDVPPNQWNTAVGTVGANQELDLLVTNWDLGIGFEAGYWSDMVRAYPEVFEFGMTMYHNAYYPSYGYVRMGDSTTFYLYECATCQVKLQYLQNMLGFNHDLFYTLWHENSYSRRAAISIVEPEDGYKSLSILATKDVSYYTGQEYIGGGGGSYDWDPTSVSALNHQTETIIIVRYNNVEGKNYIASFRADEDMLFLADTAMSCIEVTEEDIQNEFISDEPQVWTVPD